MHNKKHIIRNIIFLIVLIVLTFIVIFKNYDFNDTVKIIINADIKFIILALIVMFLDFTFEAINIRNILKSLGTNISILNGIKYTLIGFFFSGITPASSGGQPMEIYFMNKEGVPVTNATLALLTEVCSFHIVTITMGLIGAIINHKLLANGFIYVFIVGVTLNILAALVMFIFLFSRKLSNFLVDKFIKILETIKYKNIDIVKDKISKLLEEYHNGSVYIKKHKKIFIKSIFIVFLQVLMYYLVTYFIYRSFGLTTNNYIQIIFVQAMLFISVSSIPLPGAALVSESGFLAVYQTIFGISLIASGMLLYRFVNFYFYIIVSLIIIIINNFRLKNKNI